MGQTARKGGFFFAERKYVGTVMENDLLTIEEERAMREELERANSPHEPFDDRLEPEFADKKKAA